MPVTVPLSLAGVSVSAGAEGAGFGLAVGNYLCDTQACAPGCPGEQSPWSGGNNHLLCARVCGQGWGAAPAPVAQDALFSVRPSSEGSCPLPTPHGLPATVVWPLWASVRGLGQSHGGLDSLRRNPLQVNRG